MQIRVGLEIAECLCHRYHYQGFSPRVAFRLRSRTPGKESTPETRKSEKKLRKKYRTPLPGLGPESMKKIPKQKYINMAITSISGPKKGQIFKFSNYKNDPEKPPHLVWRFFAFQCFVCFLIFAFSCLSFSSFPLLLDFLKPKSGPSNEVIGINILKISSSDLLAQHPHLFEQAEGRRCSRMRVWQQCPRASTPH